MCLHLLLAAAAAAAPPAGVDLDDLDHWEGQAERFLDGPAGCWEVVGRVAWHWDAGRWGGSRGSAVFASRMRDGVWGPFHVEPLGEVVRERRSGVESLLYAYEPRWAPLFGQVDGEIRVSNDPRDRPDLPVEASDREASGREEGRRARRRSRGGSDEDPPGPTNLLRRGLDRISGSRSVTSWTRWDEERGEVMLHRAFPIDGAAVGKEAEQTVRFPAGGPPDAMDVAFPQWTQGTLPRVRVTRAEAHLRARPAGGALFPSASSFKLDFRVLGFPVSGAQSITYTSIRPCGAAERASGPLQPADGAAPQATDDAEPTG